MKYVVFTIVCIAIFGFLKPAHAAQSSDATATIQHVQDLQNQITVLKKVLASLQLQKELQADSYVVEDLLAQTPVFEKNTDRTYPIASVTKLMNAVVATENINQGQTIVLTPPMLLPLGHSPSLFPGLRISAQNLLKAALIQSTNDAAESLSYFLGKEVFLNFMNQKARSLGMANTFFYDVHGLNPHNHSSAADLAKLILYVYKNHPEILSITKDNNFWLPDPTGKLLKFKNLNNFYAMPEFVGGKTGYLPEAQETLASVFSLESRPVAIVMLHSKNRYADTLAIINKIKNTPDLLK